MDFMVQVHFQVIVVHRRLCRVPKMVGVQVVIQVMVVVQYPLCWSTGCRSGYDSGRGAGAGLLDIRLSCKVGACFVRMQRWVGEGKFGCCGNRFRADSEMRIGLLMLATLNHSAKTVCVQQSIHSFLLLKTHSLCPVTSRWLLSKASIRTLKRKRPYDRVSSSMNGQGWQTPSRAPGWHTVGCYLRRQLG